MTKGKRKIPSHFDNSKIQIYVKNDNKEFQEKIFSYLLILALVFYLAPFPLMILDFFGFMNYGIILTPIILYYSLMIYINKKTYSSVFLNIIGLISLYNLLLSLNIYNMAELSSSYYLISNIFYFYISFLIMTFDYKFYEKLQFIVNCLYVVNDKIKNNILLFFVIIFIFASFTSGIIAVIYSLQLRYIIFLSLIFLILLTITIFLFFLIFNEMNKFKIFSINILMKIENKINIFTKWLINVFKIQKLEGLKIRDNNFKINKIEFEIFVLAKILPFVFLFLNIGDNTYYKLYEKNDEEYCIENKELIPNKEKYGLIMLNNGNVMQIQDIYDKYSINIIEERYVEYKCNTLPIIIGNPK